MGLLSRETINKIFIEEIDKLYKPIQHQKEPIVPTTKKTRFSK
jgi:hypothetical protein